MANYTVDNDIVGGGGLGNGLFGGGSWGLIIILFLFFAVFTGGGLFGRERVEEPRNWQIERDVLESRYSNANLTSAGTAEIVANQNAIDQRRADRELVDAKNTIAQMQTIASITERCQHTDDEICWIKNHMAEKPPVYAEAYLQSGVRYPARSLEAGGYC